jgi:hypothetical protein
MMSGFMWALRWVAAGTILANCVVMTVDAWLDSRAYSLMHDKPLVIARVEVRSVHR